MGFSLVETLFAVFFAGLIMLGIGKLQTFGIMISDSGNKKIEAYYLADQGMAISENYLLSAGMPSCSLPCVRYISNSSDSLTETDNDSIKESYSRKIIISETPISSAYNVTVIIEWSDGIGSHTAEEGGAVKITKYLYLL